MSICARCDPATRFITGGSLAATPYADAPDMKTMEYAPIGVEEGVRTDQPIVLDIDLDYFLSNDHPDYRGRQIEIAPAAYEEFIHDRYHFLRIAPGSKVSAREREGRYYLLFNNDEAEPGPPPDSPAVRDEILQRISAFVEFLRRSSVVPALIVVCRSLRSGYTPCRYAPFIEEKLVRELEMLYPLQITYISALLPGASEAWNAH